MEDKNRIPNKGINWFPGHMAQALNIISKVLPTIDAIITIADGRAPISSINPYLQTIVQNKTQILIFSKKDLTDLNAFSNFKNLFPQYQKILFANLTNQKEIKYLLQEIQTIETKKTEKYKRYNLKTPPLRAMVVGIPNVGKSTFINLLSGKKKASVGNLPGWTRSQQLIRVNDKLELLDTPGILPSNYEDKSCALHLAWLGSMKQEILPVDYLCDTLADFVSSKYMNYITNRYDIRTYNSSQEFFNELALKRGFKLPGEVLDIDRAKKMFLKEFQQGILGKVIVDEPKKI